MKHYQLLPIGQHLRWNNTKKKIPSSIIKNPIREVAKVAISVQNLENKMLRVKNLMIRTQMKKIIEYSYAE